jgi:serine/threonine protein kinase
MVVGKPLFLGLCEIDQLMQIFYKLGVPSFEVWAEFQSLPNYQPLLFPDWKQSRLQGMLRYVTEDAELSLLLQCLAFNPQDRLSAGEALRNSYFLKTEIALTVSETMTVHYKHIHIGTLNFSSM